jgi:hypothetical protein
LDWGIVQLVDWIRARRLTVSLVTLMLLPLLMACGGNDDEPKQTGAIFAPTPTSTETRVAIASPTPPAAKATIESDLPLEVGTVANDEPIVKDVPPGPAPTQPPNPKSSFDRDGDGLYTSDELVEAVQSRFPTYEWPADYQVTADIIIQGLNLDRFPNSLFEANGEFTIIGLWHMCAWDFALLDAVRADDTTLRETSLHQLKVVSLEHWTSSDVEGRAFMLEMYDRAALGDPAGLQQYVDNNCNEEKALFFRQTSGSPQTGSESVFTWLRWDDAA